MARRNSAARITRLVEFLLRVPPARYADDHNTASMPIGEKERWRPSQIRQSSTGFDDSELLRKARVNLLFYLMNVMSTVSASTITPSTERISSSIVEGSMKDMLQEQLMLLRVGIEKAIQRGHNERVDQEGIRSQDHRDPREASGALLNFLPSSSSSFFRYFKPSTVRLLESTVSIFDSSTKKFVAAQTL
jgi:hypothetical protein